MTDSNAPEQLRKLLDERGIGWKAGLENVTWVGDWCFVEYDNGKLAATCEPSLTPEQAVAATLGRGECFYAPDYQGFTWWDENDEEHYEEYSASDECWSASCSECGNTMIVGDEGWFNGWDEIKEWTEEGSDKLHKGYVLEPTFNFCPNCGKSVKR